MMASPQIVWLSSTEPDAVKSAYLGAELLPNLGREGHVIAVSSPAERRSDQKRTLVVVVEDAESSWRLAQTEYPVKPIFWFLDVYRRGQSEQVAEQTLRHVARTAQAVIFSSERHLAEFRRHTAQQEVPGGLFLVNVPVRSAESSLVILPRERNRLAFLGGPESEFRAHKLLEALVDFPHLELRWLIDAKEETAVRALLAEYPEVSCELEFGRSPEHWQRCVSGAFAAVHTLVSAFGGLSPYLPISCAAAVPVLVSDFAEGTNLPHTFCQKIAAGRSEVEELSAAILRLLDTTCWKLFSEQALVFAGENHDSRHIAAEVRWLLEHLGASGPENQWVRAQP